MKFKSAAYFIDTALAGCLMLVLMLISACSNTFEYKPNYSKGFIKFYGGPYGDFGFDLKETSDGGYILIGSSASYGKNGNDLENKPTDVYLIKVNSEGNEQWYNTYGGTGRDTGESIILVDGGYIISGEYHNPSGITGAYLLKVNETNGSIVWEKNFLQEGYNEKGTFLLPTSDGSFLLIGNTSNVYLKIGQIFPDDKSDIMACKINQSGNMAWDNVRGFGYKGIDSGVSAVELISGSNKYYAILGTSEEPASGSPNTEFYLIITSEQGVQLNPQPFGTMDFEEARGLAKTQDGGLIMIGSKKATLNSSNSELFLIKLNLSFTNNTPTAQVQWTRSSKSSKDNFNIGYSTEGVSVQPLADGGYIVLSTIERIESGKDIHLMKLDAQGTKLWEKTFGGSGDEVASKLIVTSDGGYAILGSSSVERNPYMICLIKTDENGDVVP